MCIYTGIINWKQLTIHFILSAILLLFLPQNSYQRYSSPLYSYTKELTIITQTKNIEYTHLLVAYVTGEKRYLSSLLKKLHKHYYISHLFTPSALHFTILLKSLSPLLFHKSLKIILLLFSIFFSLPLFSISRVATYKLIQQLLPPKKFSNYTIFLLMSLLHLIFGTFKSSPPSYFYSFLFFGAITTLKEYSFLSIALVLIFAQLHLSCMQGGVFYPLHFLIGMAYSSLFGLIFPISLLYYLLPLKMLSYPVSMIFVLQDLILNHLPTFDLPLHIPYQLEIALFLLIGMINQKTRPLAMASLLIFHLTLLNLPDKKYLNRPPHISKRVIWNNLQYTNYGYFSYNRQRKCFHRIYNYKISVYCKKKGKTPLPPLSHTPRNKTKNSVRTE